MAFRVGLVLHETDPRALELGRELAAWFEERGVEAFLLDEDARRLGREPRSRESFSSADLVVSLGGDGTFLAAAHLAIQGRVPVLGVNLGRVGFLAEVEPERVFDAMEKALAGEGREEPRMTLVAEAPAHEPLVAVNEILLEKTGRRLVRLDILADGEDVGRYAADGIILATPTGSTAYNLAAGGPVAVPGLDCLILTPALPHMLFDRSVVFPPDTVIEVKVVAGHDPVRVVADGRSWFELEPGSKVRVRRGDLRLRVLRVLPHSFFEVVREKFRLPPSRPLGQAGKPSP